MVATHFTLLVAASGLVSATVLPREAKPEPQSGLLGKLGGGSGLSSKLGSGGLLGKLGGGSGGAAAAGSGNYYTEASHPKHTFYAPPNTAGVTGAPILIWGNGGCMANGLMFKSILGYLAGKGVLVIANGAPNGSGKTSASDLTASIDWITRNAGKGKYTYVDTNKIMVAGQSCGGLEAQEAGGQDRRVKTVGVLNSGQFTAAATKRVAGKITKPVIILLGGDSDIAYANGERDFKELKQNGTPVWKGNLPVGHRGDYSAPNSRFNKATWLWIDAVLNKNAQSKAYFTGNGGTTDGWSVEKGDLSKL